MAKDTADHLELLRLNVEGAAFRVRKGDDRRKAPREADRRAPGTRKVKAAPVSTSGFLSVTVSIGLAESHPRAAADEVIEQADKALYRAKQGGRNRLEIAAVNRKVKRVVKSKKTVPS
jgi:GGDEF domain-containing protein